MDMTAKEMCELTQNTLDEPKVTWYIESLNDHMGGLALCGVFEVNPWAQIKLRNNHNLLPHEKRAIQSHYEKLGFKFTTTKGNWLYPGSTIMSWEDV